MPLLHANPPIQSPSGSRASTDLFARTSSLIASARLRCIRRATLLHQLHRRPIVRFPATIAMTRPPSRAHHLGLFLAPGDHKLNLLRVGASLEPSASGKTVANERFRVLDVLASCGFRFALVLITCGLFTIRCQRVLAVEAVTDVVVGLKRSTVWPKVMQVLNLFREQGLVLAMLLGLSAFFSMAETSITTLWPWKVRELAEKEPENGVFRMLRSDVTRFLTTILIGTTVVNIGATALVTDAATAIFGEAGVSAATGVMTVAILLLTEITPKSVAVHNATEVARIVVRPVAWLSFVLYPVGRVVTFMSMGMLKLLGLKGRRPLKGFFNGVFILPLLLFVMGTLICYVEATKRIAS